MLVPSFLFFYFLDVGLGVQDVARDTNRGHTVRAVCESFHLGKDSGFKIVSHMMPDLPNVGLERDIDQFIVSESRFQNCLVRINRF